MSSSNSLYGPDASILITGASSGIGAELARQVARHGGRVALLARRRQRLEAVAGEVADLGGKPLVLEGDVTDLDQVRAMHLELVRVQGPVDVAFLNAGVGDPGSSPTRFDAVKVRRVFEVNLFGVVNWVDALLPDMIPRQRGVLAVVSSQAAARAIPGTGAYSASKAAVSSLMESIRAEARQHGVQVTIIEPGFIKSEMTEKHKFPMPWLMDTDEAAARMLQAVAAGQTQVRFPWQMSALMGLYRQVPNPLYDRLALAMGKKKFRPGKK